MAYEPTSWKAGDVVTSAKLNKMEQGIAGAISPLIVNVVHDDPIKARLDKTWQEIYDAGVFFVFDIIQNDGGVSSHDYSTGNVAVYTGEQGNQYSVTTSSGLAFSATGPNEYPYSDS